MSAFRVEAFTHKNESWAIQTKHDTADEAHEAAQAVAATGRKVRVTDARGAVVSPTAASPEAKPESKLKLPGILTPKTSKPAETADQ